MSAINRFFSLIPGFGVKLSAIIVAGPTVLSAAGARPPHDGVRRAMAAPRIISAAELCYFNLARTIIGLQRVQ
jgi:hypothetical protein